MDERAFKRPISDLHLPPVKSLDFQMNIHAAVIIMQRENIGSVVITEKDRVVGILTERDILKKVVGIIEDYKKALVTEIMTREPTCIRLSDEIGMALNLIEEGGFRHLPVLADDGTPLSIVLIKDVLAYLAHREKSK